MTDHQGAASAASPVSAMLTAAHVVFAAQQALRADSIKPLVLDECDTGGARKQAVPLFVGAKADAIMSEIEDL